MFEILLIVLALGLTIFVHELGHFISAKSMKIPVEVFSMGLGPKLFGVKRGETEYIVSLFFMFGGYVKMRGENPNEHDRHDNTGFLNQHPSKKILVSVAGVTMNMILAVGLMFVVFTAGAQSLRPVVGEVKEGYPAEAAGIKKGDIIESINGIKTGFWDDVTKAIAADKSGKLVMTLIRNGGQASVEVVPVIEEYEDMLKDKKERAFIGISPLAYLPVIDSLEPGYPAKEAGLKKGDIIRNINGVKINYWDQVTPAVALSTDGETVIKVERDGTEKTFSFKAKPDKGENGEARYLMGISPLMNTAKQRLPFDRAAARAVTEVRDMTMMTVRALYKMVSRKIETDVAGPIGVMQISYKVAKTGIVNLIFLFAIININLALINLLPILPLDGGLVGIFLVEWVKGSPVSIEVQEKLMQFGWMLLIGLIVFFTYNDILRIIKG
ncbi:MAG TPA: RIP metalloprotease RseP [bacterium]|nr:RIP metalloprotease RseP [bacterium]